MKKKKQKKTEEKKETEKKNYNIIESQCMLQMSSTVEFNFLKNISKSFIFHPQPLFYIQVLSISWMSNNECQYYCLERTSKKQ